MATVLVDTNLSSLTLAAGENIDVGSGAVLTIDSSVTDLGNIRIYDNLLGLGVDGSGTVDIVNTSTTTPIVIQFFNNGDDFRIEAAGLLRIRGDFITILTSDGTGGQTVDCSNIGGVDIIQPSFIEVETGNGTGVYETWPVIFTGGVHPHIPATEFFAQSNFNGVASPIGQFCFYDFGTQILTFGDGTNGTIPVNGARIRTPNIIFHSAVTVVANSSRSQFDLNPGGTFDGDTFQCTNAIYCAFAGCGDIQVRNAGFTGRCYLSSSSAGGTFDNIVVSHDAVDTTPSTSGVASTFGAVSVNRYKSVTTTVAAMLMSIVPGLTSLTNVMGVVLTRNSGTSDSALAMTNCPATANYEGIIAIGGPVRATNWTGGQISNIQASNNVQGSVSTAIASDVVRLTNCNGTVINNIRRLTGGSGVRNYICYSDSQSANCLFHDIIWNGSNVTRYLAPYLSAGTTIANADLTNMSGSTPIIDGTGARGVFRNITGDVGTLAQQGSSARLEFVEVPAMSTGLFPGYVDGGQFHVLVDSSLSTGRIAIGPFGPESEQDAFDAVIGTPQFKATGVMELASGDEVILKSQAPIRSVTSLQNVALTEDFTGTATYEFRVVDFGGDITAQPWQAATGANFAAVVIADSDVGIEMQIRIQVTADGGLREIQVRTNNDAAFAPAVGTVPFTITGGAPFAVVGLMDNTVPSAPVLVDYVTLDASGSGVASFPYNFDKVAVPYLLRIRLQGYTRVEITGNVTGAGVVLPVSMPQQLDFDGVALYQNTTTPNVTVTYSQTDNLINIADAIVTGQQIYDVTQDAEVTETGITFPPFSDYLRTSNGNYLAVISGTQLYNFDGGSNNTVNAIVSGNAGQPVDGSNGPIAIQASSGFTLQDIRDAMKLAPSAGAADADSIDDRLDRNYDTTQAVLGVTA